MPNIVKALSGIASLDDVRHAYESDHQRVRAEVQVAPDAYKRTLSIEGRFLDRADGAYAGKFGRRIEIVSGRFRVYHGIIEIEESYQEEGIAWAHYVRALRFYHSILRADSVYMDADYQGPYAWGDFGFEFSPGDWNLMLRRLDSLYSALYQGSPERHPATATELKHLEGPDGFPVGEEAIRSVHEARKDLRMVLDFNDNRTIRFLKDEGILEP